MGPVWLQRLSGFSVHVDKICYPQWISNEEYCYLRVENFYDYGIGFSGISKGFNPWLCLRSPNATFYIYKVNINKPDEAKLIKKITKKVKFCIAKEESKLPFLRGEFIFRRLEDDNFILLIRDSSKYIAYYINKDGKIFKKQALSYDYIKWDSLDDISPDCTKLLIRERGCLYIKQIGSTIEKKISEPQLYYNDYVKWLNRENIVLYRVFHFYAEKKSEQDKYEVYILNDKEEDMQLVFGGPCEDFEKMNSFLLDAAMSPKSNLLFLSKIGIFGKEYGKWQMIKDFKKMETEYFYPDISPDSQKIIGLEDTGNDRPYLQSSEGLNNIGIIEKQYKLKIIELKDFLKQK